MIVTHGKLHILTRNEHSEQIGLGRRLHSEQLGLGRRLPFIIVGIIGISRVFKRLQLFYKHFHTYSSFTFSILTIRIHTNTYISNTYKYLHTN